MSRGNFTVSTIFPEDRQVNLIYRDNVLVAIEFRHNNSIDFMFSSDCLKLINRLKKETDEQIENGSIDYNSSQILDIDRLS